MVAVNPFAMVAVTTRGPAAVVFTVLPVMVAPVVPAVLTDQTIGALLVALSGSTVPERASAVPTTPVVGILLMPVTATNGLLNTISKPIG